MKLLENVTGTWFHDEEVGDREPLFVGTNFAPIANFNRPSGPIAEHMWLQFRLSDTAPRGWEYVETFPSRFFSVDLRTARFGIRGAP